MKNPQHKQRQYCNNRMESKFYIFKLKYINAPINHKEKGKQSGIELPGCPSVCAFASSSFNMIIVPVISEI